VASATLSPQLGATFGFAGLFVVLAAAHFFLNSAALNQFSESADGLSNRFTIANN